MSAKFNHELVSEPNVAESESEVSSTRDLSSFVTVIEVNGLKSETSKPAAVAPPK